MTRRLELDPESGDIKVCFPYDPDLLPVVRSLPGRRWHPDDRHWSIPAEFASEAAVKLRPYGFELSPELRARLADDGGEGLPLEPSANEPPAPAPEDRTLTVSHLNEMVRGALQRAFPGALWVTGEVLGHDRNAHKKHIYFQLAEKAEGDDRPRAVVDAVIFERERMLIQRRLARGPEPVTLGDGVKIRVRAKIDLYPPTGSYQLVIDDIDPEFTLGEIARRRERILTEVRRRGLQERNLALAFPRPCLRIGLITSLESDAYNDFTNELESSPYAFRVDVCDAHVQGQFVERDVLRALHLFGRRARSYDAIAIVRGGGARTELMAFDSLALALAVAEHPVKILVGIGHHRDLSVLDSIAHSEKTPTAVAKRLVMLAEAETDALERAVERLRVRSHQQVDRTRGELGAQAALLGRTLELRLSQARVRPESWARRLEAGVMRLVERRGVDLDGWGRALQAGATRQQIRERERLERAAARVPGLAENLVRRQIERLEGRRSRARALDPARLLDRGYAWVRDEAGRSVKRVSDVDPGQSVEVELSDGKLRATVNETHPSVGPDG